MDRLAGRLPQVGHERQCDFSHRTAPGCALAQLEQPQSQNNLGSAAFKESDLFKILDEP